MITRFAIQYNKESIHRKHGDIPGWLDTRMSMFNRYCLPSVQAQTIPFDWLFLVDPNFPAWDDKYAKVLEQHGRIVYMGVDFDDGQKEVGGMLNNYTGWICTTRLDSDDIIANDFMSQVSSLTAEEEMWIVFRQGYMLHDNKLHLKMYKKNPFLSYVEYADGDVKSVFKENHHNFHRDAKRRNILCKVVENNPMWIQVVHDNNVGNQPRKLSNIISSTDLVRHNFTWLNT